MSSCEPDDYVVYRASEILATLPVAERFTWPFKYRKLAERLAKEGCIDGFLSWPTVRESLFAGQTHAGLRELSAFPKWLSEMAMDPDWPPLPDDAQSRPSDTYIRQAVLVYLLYEKLDWTNIETVFEVGGGFGAMSVVLRRFGFDWDHEVLDHPIMHLLRTEYLASVGTRPAMSLNAPTLESADVFIAAHSLCEMPPAMREDILNSVPARLYAISVTNVFDGVRNDDWFRDWFKRNGIAYTDTFEWLRPSQTIFIADREE